MSTYLVFLFLIAVFFFAHPYDLLWTVEHQATAAEYVAQVEEGRLSRRLSLLTLGAFAMILLYQNHKRNRLRVSGLLGWFILFFILLSAASIAWSEDISLTIRRVGVLLMLLSGALAFAERYSFQDIVTFAFFGCGVTLLFGFCAEVVLGTFHPFGREYRFAGTFHPNQQAMYCAIFFIATLSLALTTRRMRYLYLGVTLVAFLFLLLTRSRTAVASAILASSVYLVLVSSRVQKIAFVFVMIIVLCISFMVFSEELNQYSRTAVFLGRGYDESGEMTGRLLIWEECLQYVAKRPLLGYGYNSFWTPRHIYEFSETQKWGRGITAAHSDYLEMVLNLGVIGGVAYVLIIVLGIKRSLELFKSYGHHGHLFALAILVWFSLNSILETINLNPWFPVFLFMILLGKLGFVAHRSPSFRYREIP